MLITEITGYLENGMWGYGPPFPEVEIKQVASIEEHGYEGHKIIISTLSGTYLETAAHRIKGAPTIDQIPIKKLIVDASIIKIPHKKKANEFITVDEMDRFGTHVKEGDALLVYTGWDEKWNEPIFISDCPHFHKETLDWILEKKIYIWGSDIPRYDDPKRPAGLLKIFYQTIGGLVLAPVVNLGTINASRAKLIVLPLPVRGVCAAPCRALVFENGL